MSKKSDEPVEFEYEPVERNLRNARNIQLGINIICAFLFILVFDLVFGWQHFRPAASKKIFVENLAKLALTEKLIGEKKTTLTPFAQGILKLAQEHCSMIHKLNPPKILFWKTACLESLSENPNIFLSDTDSLKHYLDDSISNKPIWYQEEYLRLFVQDVETLKGLLQKRVEEKCKDTSDKVTDDTCTEYAQKLSLENAQVSFCLQEIKDRFQVNEETRGRRVSPRKYEVPVIGISAQIEDIGVPVAVFLLILTYWLYNSLINAYDSTKTYLDKLKGLWKKNRECKIKDLVNKYHFIQLPAENRDEFRLNLGLLWLFLLPYLLVISHLLADLHEATLLDFRYHGSEYLFESSTLYAFNILMVPRFLIAFLLAFFGWLMLSRFIKTYGNIMCEYGICSEEGLDEFIKTKKKQATPLFIWIVTAPFSIFGTFSAFYFAGDLYKRDYFLSGTNLWLFLGIILSFFFITFVLSFVKANNPKHWWFQFRPSLVPLTLLLYLYLILLLVAVPQSKFKFLPFPQPWVPGALTLLCFLIAILFICFDNIKEEQKQQK